MGPWWWSLRTVVELEDGGSGWVISFVGMVVAGERGWWTSEVEVALVGV